MSNHLLAYTDRELGMTLVSVEQVIAEVEAYACEPEDYARAPYEAREALIREMDERMRLGISFSRPDESFEVEYAPYGLAWEREQAEIHA